MSDSRIVYPCEYRAALRVIRGAIANDDAGVLAVAHRVAGCYRLGLRAGRDSLAIVAAFDLED